MQRQQIKMFSDPLNCQLFQTFGESFRKKFFLLEIASVTCDSICNHQPSYYSLLYAKL